MTNTVAFFYILIMGLIFSLFLPWWTIVIPCFFVGLLTIERIFQAFLTGLISIFLLWLSFAGAISLITDSTLDTMITELFNLPSPFLLLVVSALTGGLVGGLSCMTGTLFRKAMNFQSSS